MRLRVVRGDVVVTRYATLILPIALAGCPALLSDWSVSGSSPADASSDSWSPDATGGSSSDSAGSSSGSSSDSSFGPSSGADAASIDVHAGSEPEPEGGPEAEAGALQEAAADVAPPACTMDLSNVGNVDFHISFTISTSATGVTVALLSQRSGCVTTSPFWDVTLSSTGGVTLSTGDGSGTTYFVEAGNAVNDGQPHRVVVQRVAGLISYWRDGVLGSSMSPDPDAFGALPALATGTSACMGTVPLTGHGTLTNLCITSP